ncbi:MAG: amidophosphoribosyltransferase [Dehalococcoidia bacterium SM23_28_2]|nr:MAG: amidophosphoribosyltransferase [Dehalococcoidia bacterium SM23_28_2]
MSLLSGLRESCGVFGVYAPGEDVARVTFYGLYALQHRGQESAGIATANGSKIHLRTGMGLISQVFDEDALSCLPGQSAIGHTRYSTTGSSRIENAQPLYLEGPRGPLALAHNGNLVNAEVLRHDLEEQGYTLETSSDSELIASLLASAPGTTWEKRLGHVMRRIQGAYCVVGLTPNALLAMRDPYGIRPLCLGSLNGGWVVASESCALDHLGATYLREVEPGEALYIDETGVNSYKPVPSQRHALCIFEYIYFSRPDSLLHDNLLYPVRMAMGAELARQYPVEADLVIGVPDSAIAAAIGYSHQSGIPYAEGLVKNRYVGRTFIQPHQRLREVGVYLKFNPLRELLEDQRLVVVDDSIVRGTTTPRVVEMLRRAGAREVHMRITAPPIRHPCFFGIDMASRWELIASHKSVEEIRRHIDADSLAYQTIDGLLRAVAQTHDSFCMACFTGDYPMEVQLQMDKLVFERRPVRAGEKPEPVPAAWTWEEDRH